MDPRESESMFTTAGTGAQNRGIQIPTMTAAGPNVYAIRLAYMYVCGEERYIESNVSPGTVRDWALLKISCRAP